MSRLVRQRLENDCAVASLAMLTNLPHDVVRAAVEGLCWEEDKGLDDFNVALKRLGFTERQFRVFDLQRYEFDLEILKIMLYGRPAILTVESINEPDGWHSIFWDGEKVMDPSNLKRFTKLSQVRDRLVEIVFFDERRT